MPLVDIHLDRGVFTTGQQKTMIGKVTDAMVAVENESLRNLTWLTAGDVKTLAAG